MKNRFVRIIKYTLTLVRLAIKVLRTLYFSHLLLT